MNADDKAAEAKVEARRNRWAKWLWLIVLGPPSIVAYFLLDFETFVRITSLVTLLLSIAAMSLTSHAAQKGAEAKAAGYENP